MDTRNEVDALALRAFSAAVDSEKQQTPLQIGNLLTEREKVTIGRRLLIAHAILDGKTRYEISHHIHVSPNTFAQIRKWLDSEFTSYSSAYKEQPASNAQTKEYPQRFSYAHLKKNYPAHFLLFSLVEELFKLSKE